LCKANLRRQLYYRWLAVRQGSHPWDTVGIGPRP